MSTTAQVHFRIGLVTFFLLLAPKVQSQQVSSPWKASVDLEKIDSVIAKMSLEQKVGQLFIFGFSGQSLTKKHRAWMNQLKPGSVILFRRNIKTPQQTIRLNQALQETATKVSGLPVFIMLDQEGGLVNRIPLSQTPPSALALGMTKNPGLVSDVGRATGGMIQALGFNMNLAPVLDLSDPYRKTFLGSRSFGIDADLVSEYGLAFSNGLQEAGVIPAAKHFPGHGEVTEDSHKSLPQKLDSLEDLLSGDLRPFRRYVSDSTQPTALMVAHLAYPNIDPSGLPASFSKILIQDLLRERLKYEGLVMTDDIEMLGADLAGNISERTIKAIEAGNDLIMVAWSMNRQKQSVQAVLQAIKSGRLSEDRINQSLRRIVKAKLRLESSKNSRAFAQFQESRRALLRLTRDVNEHNFKRATAGFSYLKESLNRAQKALIYTPEPSFYKAFRQTNLKDARMVHLRRGLNLNWTGAIQKHETLGIFLVTGEGSARILATAPAEIKKRLFVMNAAHPGLIEDTADYMAVMNLYHNGSDFASWFSEYFFQQKDPLTPDKRRPATNQEPQEPLQ